MNSTSASLRASPYSLMNIWSCGQRSLTRIGELSTLCDLMAQRPNALPEAGELAEQAKKFLATAKHAADRKRPPWGRFGAFIDTIETNIHAALCLLLRYMPLEELKAWLPELNSFIRAHLPARDPRRLAVEEILDEEKLHRRLEVEESKRKTARPKAPAVEESARSTQEEPILDESKRETVVIAVHAALEARENEYIRVRSFRNIVYGVTLCLTLLAIALGVVMAVEPTLVPICFQPETQIVCPTASEPKPVQNGSSSAKLDPDPMFEKLVSRADYFVIELVGLVAAALAAAVTLRQLRGTAVPYSVPLALALLKLPTGALTAVLGLLLMRGEFIPGLTALDTSAQIIAWAVVFGYAQQLFTRLVDERGQSILNSVGGSEHGTLMDQRMNPTPGTTS